MLIATLFTIAKKWKQPKCPLIDEWIKRCEIYIIYTYMYIHTHVYEYYSAIKKNEIMAFATTWIRLECISLSVISQTEKDIYGMTSLVCEI